MRRGTTFARVAAVVGVAASLVGLAGAQTASSGRAAAPPAGTLLFAARVGDGFRIYTVATDGSRLTQLGDGRDPSWSPDGSSISYARHTAGDWDIVRAAADGGARRRLDGSTPALDLSPAWSPDGTRIAFATLNGASWEIHAMDADGTDAYRVSGDSASADLAPVWSPDSTRIAFSSFVRGRFEIDLIRTDGTGARRLTGASGGDDITPAWSPDGRWIAFGRITARGTGGIGLVPADGGKEVVLPTAAGTVTSSPSWSADGSWISVRMTGADGRSGIELIAADSSTAIEVPLPAELDVVGASAWKPVDGAHAAPSTGVIPRVATMPAVVGLQVAEAREILRARGIVASYPEFPSNEPAGAVVAQSRPAGARIERGQRVQVNVSNGVPPSGGSGPPTTMPDLRGMIRDRALLTMQGAGLVPSFKTVPSVQPAGTVVSQAKAPGAQLRAGTRVQVNLSQG